MTAGIRWSQGLRNPYSELNLLDPSMNRWFAKRSHKRFNRSFALSPAVAMGQITAGYKNGILLVTRSKRQEAKPHSIPVDVHL